VEPKPFEQTRDLGAGEREVPTKVTVAQSVDGVLTASQGDKQLEIECSKKVEAVTVSTRLSYRCGDSVHVAQINRGLL
jgi:CxxC motif-containing protein